MRKMYVLCVDSTYMETIKDICEVKCIKMKILGKRKNKANDSTEFIIGICSSWINAITLYRFGSFVSEI